MDIDLSHTALLVIDCQKGFEHPTYWGHTRSNPSFEKNLTALLEAFRSKHSGHPTPTIIHVYHKSSNPQSPLHPSNPGADFLPCAAPRPGEAVISKTVNSSFIGTDLEERIRAGGIRRLYIAGLTTDHCVSTTTRMAANLGVTDRIYNAGIMQKGEVMLIDDATATFNRGKWDAETVHHVEVESLREEFATIVKTKDVEDQLYRCT